MPQVSVPWGAGRLDVALPGSWTIQQVAEPSLRSAPADWRDRLARSMAQPGAGPRLPDLLKKHRRGRVCLIVEDLTRQSPLGEILRVVLREIDHASVPRENMEIVFATGMHPALTEEQAKTKLAGACEGIARRCNPWREKGAHLRLGRVGSMDVEIDRGVVEADLRIIISSVSPHLQAGFGGGYKMLVPGCASLQTICALHRLGIERSSRQLVGAPAARNPMRRAIDAAGRLLDTTGGRTFALQYLLGEDDLPVSFGAGDVVATQRMLAKQCAVASGVMVTRAADVLITNAHPRDFDLWQAFKCIPNTRWAARPEGVIICLARCAGGMKGMKTPRWPLSPAWTRRIIRATGPNGLASLLTRLVPRLAGDAAFFVRLAMQSVHRNTILMVSPALAEAGATFPGLALFARVEDAVEEARRVVGAGAQRVIVFPSGGTTFPVMTPTARRRPGAQ